MGCFVCVCRNWQTLCDLSCWVICHGVRDHANGRYRPGRFPYFIQILILRKEFKPLELLQLPLSFLFGWFVDICKWLLSGMVLSEYWMSLIVLLTGCLVLALGACLTVLSQTVMNSGEAFVNAVSRKTGKVFGNIKVVFDVSLVAIAVILSLVFFGRIEGAREGTVIAALVSGFIIRALSRWIGPLLNRWYHAGSISVPLEEQPVGQES